jgi:hypothetical protein
MKAKKTMKGQEALNHRSRKDKKSESSSDLTAYNKILKQQKQLKCRNRHIPVNINIEY